MCQHVVERLDVLQTTVCKPALEGRDPIIHVDWNSVLPGCTATQSSRILHSGGLIRTLDIYLFSQYTLCERFRNRFRNRSHKVFFGSVSQNVFKCDK
jgi:hypothetical protein